MFYTRSQLVVLLAVVITAAMGIGIGHWRRAHPEIVARLERFDRTPVPPRPTVDELPLAQPSGRRAAPKPPPMAQRIDVNRATEDELRTLPGIGAVLASRIVEARERDGPFASLDDLRRVRGLGRAKLDKLIAAIALEP